MAHQKTSSDPLQENFKCPSLFFHLFNKIGWHCLAKIFYKGKMLFEIILQNIAIIIDQRKHKRAHKNRLKYLYIMLKNKYYSAINRAKVFRILYLYINILLEYALWRIIKNTHSYIKSFIQYFAYEYLNHINQGMVYDWLNIGREKLMNTAIK